MSNPSTPVRRRAIRRQALQILFMLDQGGCTDELTKPLPTDSLYDETEQATELDADEQAAARELAHLAWDNHAASDVLVTRVADNWPPRRQPPVDRAIIRLAVYEINSGRTPVAIAIDEAIELAKQFSGENSPRFVHGVLDRLVQDGTIKSTTDREAPPTAPAPKADAATWLSEAQTASDCTEEGENA